AEIEHRGLEERTSQALRESESHFRAIFEQAAVGMADASLDTRFIRLNQRFCEIMGYSRAQLLRDETSSFAVEKRYLRKDGGVVWANLLVSLLRSPSGDPRHFVAIVED